MPMIDIGLKIEISSAQSGTTLSTLTWTKLKDCTAVPALVQPSAKIATDFVGDEFTSEILGKKGITGLDFTFAYDGTGTNDQYKKLSDMDKAGTQHWLRVTYPDGTKFEMLVNVEVSLVAVSPSAELDYTMSVTPVKQTLTSSGNIELIHVVEQSGTDPLAQAPGA